MKGFLNHKIVIIVSLTSLAIALYFGLTTTVEQYNYPNTKLVTDWGRVALTLVFGFGGCMGLLSALRKSG